MQITSSLFLVILVSLTNSIQAFTKQEASFAQLGYLLTAPPREAQVSTSLSTSASKFYSLSLTACTSSLSYLPLLNSQPNSIQSTPLYKEILAKITEVCDQSKISGVHAGEAKTSAQVQDVQGAQKGNKGAGKASIVAVQGEKEIRSYWKSL